MKKAILNYAVGSTSSWYFRGQDVLRRSLKEFSEDKLLVSGSLINPEEQTSPYQEKVSWIKEQGVIFDMLLWLDCSITAVRSLQPIWDHIESNGVYLYQSGANCAQTCNDNCLKRYGITRDEAELIPECASNVVGINLNHPAGKLFFDLWVNSLESGANFGVKWPSETERLLESQDPRFKYHRQDQSSASLAAHLASVKLDREGHFVVRAENLEHHDNDSIIFVLRGGVGE